MREGGVGSLIVAMGIVMVVFGLILAAVERGKLPSGSWRLPGDVSYHSGPVRVWIPLGTCLLVSVVLSILLNLFLRK